jgi:hypothetical protein
MVEHICTYRLEVEKHATKRNMQVSFEELLKYVK